ncbi:MAG: hypothetical protein QOG79_3920 [Mycobacterium sp.]|jgi:hypothetical protein|nr:hypothetical protein [Mycobacterium sp.]MDT5196229.1 hypothetical protein [Mycobacterium sp.]MDT5264295.1 hypothetical protein [Mycobacterium sp.]MDT5291031.1 hypothetical protein [Mycobacterium sp.]MDT5300678.1 hypothetical protein [Mycobacterium sp.]
MALGVNPYNPSDSYTVNMLQRYPGHDMCDGVTIPDNY